MVDGELDNGMAVCCAFDRFGLYLACGCCDGRVVVWDFSTRSVAREYLAHAQAVTSVRCALSRANVMIVTFDSLFFLCVALVTTCSAQHSWSRSGRRLLTSSNDWTVKMWDVVNDALLTTVRFDAPVLSAQLHPTK